MTTTLRGKGCDLLGQNTPLKLLFVKLKNIGDALLLTPTLTGVKAAFPNAEIWIAVRKGTEGILTGCPAIHRIVTFAAPDASQRQRGSWFADLQTVLNLRKERFDYAFELSDGDRGRWIVALSAAKNLWKTGPKARASSWWDVMFGRFHVAPWGGGHRVTKDYAPAAIALNLSSEIPPLSFEKPLTLEPEIVKDLDDFVVFHPVARWNKKRWPQEHWVQLGLRLLKHTKTIVISAGPDPLERALASELVDALGAQYAVSTDGTLDWAELAACLYKSRLFVGIDTAATHLAAACQCPIVGLFYPQCMIEQWRPWKAPNELLHASLLGHQSKATMADISPDLAYSAALKMIRPSATLSPNH